MFKFSSIGYNFRTRQLLVQHVRISICSLACGRYFGVSMIRHAAADYDAVSEFDCENCYSECGFWMFDFKCHLNRALCLGVVGIVDSYCQDAVTRCQLENREISSETSNFIHQANNLLVDKNLFTREFVDSVDVFFCELLQDGLSPTDDVVLFQMKYSTIPLLNFTKELAHEYFHTVQHRQMGTENLYCKYIVDSFIAGGGFFEGNPIEKETYDFEEETGKCLFESEGCPSSPVA